MRALTNFNPTKWGDIGLSLSQSQPSSPMKKETSSAFKFPTDSSHSAFEQPRKDIIVSSIIDHNKFDSCRLSRLMYDRSVVGPSTSLFVDSGIVNKIHFICLSLSLTLIGGWDGVHSLEIYA